MSVWDELNEAHPWPEIPEDLDVDHHGWIREGTIETFRELLSDATGWILEIGSWLGLSARTMLDLAPSACLVCVDTWTGGPEHQPGVGPAEISARLPRLYQQAARNLVDYRDRVCLLRADSLAGIREVAAAGYRPDLIYLDACHEFPFVLSELTLLSLFWPNIPIVGDDPWMEPVAGAAQLHAAGSGRRLEFHPEMHCFTFQ